LARLVSFENPVMKRIAVGPPTVRRSRCPRGTSTTRSSKSAGPHKDRSQLHRSGAPSSSTLIGEGASTGALGDQQVRPPLAGSCPGCGLGRPVGARAVRSAHASRGVGGMLRALVQRCLDPFEALVDPRVLDLRRLSGATPRDREPVVAGVDQSPNQTRFAFRTNVT
jgi:hypothetical protein